MVVASVAGALSIALPAPASAAGHGCFREHLEDAIALNTERMPLYSAVTGGDSTGLSLALIGSEMVTLVLADSFDRRAEYWEQRGIDVVCDAFVPIDLAPDFAAAVPPPRDVFTRRDGALLAVRLGWTYAWYGDARLAHVVEQELEKLADAPAYHCMLRHILESILRAAYLAPLHADRAEQLGIASPARLSRDLIASQIATLAIATAFDRVAAPMQARGVGILCHDVPPIDPT